MYLIHFLFEVMVSNLNLKQMPYSLLLMSTFTLYYSLYQRMSVMETVELLTVRENSVPFFVSK